jgi:hypothetical protein
VFHEAARYMPAVAVELVDPPAEQIERQLRG